MTQSQIGLIGVGLLGTALAERLRQSGFAILGFDLAPTARERLQSLGGQVATSANEVLARCPRSLLSLPDSDTVHVVLAAAEPHLPAGALLIDTTTGDPRSAAAWGERLALQSVGWIDASISGSSRQVREGTAIILAGGQGQDLARAADLLQAIAPRIFPVGPWGAGARMKLVTNLVLGLNRAALAEGLALAEALGLDAQQVLDVLLASAAYSRAMDAKGAKMIARSFAPQARLSQHLKDVELILAEGARADQSLPFTQIHRELLAALMAAGHGDLDNSAILMALRPDGPRDANDGSEGAGGISGGAAD